MSESEPSLFEDTRYDWAGSFRNLLGDILTLHVAKANDYTGGVRDPLFNYRMAAVAADCSAHQLMLARIQEKVTRLASLFQVERQVAETEEDTLLDIANIALLIINDRRRVAYDRKRGVDPSENFRFSLMERSK